MVCITNNTNTLNGALMELAETIADNLTTKGVTASPNDGLTTLANKVLNISNSGGSGSSNCITFSFDGDSVLGENIPSDKFYFIELTNGTVDYLDSEINHASEQCDDDVIIYCGDLSDYEDALDAIMEYDFPSEYYADVPNGYLQLVGTLEYPNGTLSYNCQNGGGSGSCYKVEFTSDCDDESSGSDATLYVFARYQYQPLTNTQLTLTGSDNSSYTATTDSNGIATFNVSMSANTTYTCTYQGSTDTIAVEYSQYLFYDACSSSSKLSKYGSPVTIYNSSISGTPTLEYNSTENAYQIYGTTYNDYLIYPIPKLTGKDNFTFQAEIKVNNSTSYPYLGLGVMPSESNLTSTYADHFYIYRYNASQVYAYAYKRRRTSSSSLSSGRVTHAPTNWMRIRIVFNSSGGYTCYWEELDGTNLKTYTGTISTSTKSDRHYGIYIRCGNSTSYKGYIRNIKAEANS